jgi:hypothetical protein
MDWRHCYWRNWILSKIYQKQGKTPVKKGSSFGKEERRVWDFLVKRKQR